MGLATREKQIPQIVETVTNSKYGMEKYGMERIEWLNVLAKQVLSPAELHAHCGRCLRF